MATPRADMEKLTTPKLREWAQEKYPGIVGVSGMKKEDLIAAVIAEEVAQGLRPKEEKQTVATASMGAAQLKARITIVKRERQAAEAAKDAALLQRTRQAIKRMKRRLRKLRSVS